MLTRSQVSRNSWLLDVMERLQAHRAWAREAGQAVEEAVKLERVLANTICSERVDNSRMIVDIFLHRPIAPPQQ